MITIKVTLKSGREIELTEAELRELRDAFDSLKVSTPIYIPTVWTPHIQPSYPTWKITSTGTGIGSYSSAGKSMSSALAGMGSDCACACSPCSHTTGM